MTTTDPRFPIGRFDRPATVTLLERDRFITDIEMLPGAMRNAVAGLEDAQLDTPYRDGGWTVRQVVHHLPDSHMNAYVRFKLALTEHEPVIKTYEEARWAELPDSMGPVEVSLALVGALHQRWVMLMRAMTDDQWQRPFRHPEWGALRLDGTLALYSWHGRHHLAHVTELRRGKGW